MVTAVAFSPDGHRLASASDDTTVRCGTPRPANHRRLLTGHTDDVPSVAFTPDGHRLATGGGDGTVRLWNIDAASQPSTGHTDYVTAWRSAQTVSVLPAAARRHRAVVERRHRPTDRRPARPATSRSVNGGVQPRRPPAGQRRLATTARWIVERRHRPALGGPLTGHTDHAVSLAFSPDGHRLVTGSGDHTVRVWDTDTDHPVGAPLVGHTDWVTTSRSAPTVTGWPAPASTPRCGCGTPTPANPSAPLLAGTLTRCYDVAFSPDGHRLATRR